MQIEEDKTKTAKKTNKDLLRFEKPIYDVYDKDKYASEKEFMLKKLIQQKKKPNFSLLPQSSLLNEVRQFIPLLKEANKKLEGKTDIQIDTNMQQQQSSEESSEEQDKTPKETIQVEPQADKVIQLNFLVAKYPEGEESSRQTL